MKKITLRSVLLCFVTAAVICVVGLSLNAFADTDVVAINADTFPDRVFRDYVCKYDADKNGFLSDSEIQKVTGISVNQKGITSLEGIKYFTSLETLYCFGNSKLTALDVSGLKALRQLDCYDCKLTTLDVSGCTALKELYCSENELTSLDVKSCTALRKLFCSENKLTTLNVRNNEYLEMLDCQKNELISLYVLQSDGDMSKIWYLTYVTCSYNNLTTLDVSCCWKLQKLNCRNNKLTSINITDCRSLGLLYCENNYMKSKSSIIGLDTIRNLDKLDFRFDPQNSNDTVKGDINGDGILGNKDITALRKYISDGNVYPDAADVNGDGSLGNKDVTALRKILAEI